MALIRDKVVCAQSVANGKFLHQDRKMFSYLPVIFHSAAIYLHFILITFNFGFVGIAVEY